MATTTTIGSNVYKTTQLVENAIGVILSNALVASSPEYTIRGLDTKFGKRGGKIGSSLERRLPQRFRGYAGRRAVYEPLEDPTYNIVIDNERGVAWDSNAWERTLFASPERVHDMAPAMNELTSVMDLSATMGFVSPASDAATTTRAGYPQTQEGNLDALSPTTGVQTPRSDGAAACQHAFGKAGSRFTDTPPVGTAQPAGTQDVVGTLARAGARLEAEAVPGRKVCFMPPTMSQEASTALLRLYHPATSISAKYNRARMDGSGMNLGIDIYERSQNLDQHTAGNLDAVAGGGLQVKTAPGDGTNTITFKGAGASKTGALKKGDVIGYQTGTGNDATQIAAINPTLRQATSSEFQQVVLADADSTSGGDVTVTVFPPFAAGTGGGTSGDASKRNQRMSRLPAANDYAVLNGVPILNAAAGDAMDATFDTGYIVTPQTVAMVFVKLELPKNEEQAYEVSIENEMYLQVIKSYDSLDRQFNCRMDAVWGVRNVRREFGGKLFGRKIA